MLQMYRVLIEQPNFFKKNVVIPSFYCLSVVVPRWLFLQKFLVPSFCSLSLLIQILSLLIQILCLFANLGADASESGTRDVRIWEQMRPSLGAETVERGMAFADKWRDRITITKYVVLERVTRGGRGAEGGTRPSSRILFPVVRSWRRDKC